MDTNNRASTYSGNSSFAGLRPTSQHQNTPRVSTSTLLNALHTAYATQQPHRIDANSTIVVSTWATAAESNGGANIGAGNGQDSRPGSLVDESLAQQVWEHARRRAEDACVILGSLHASTPSLLSSFVAQMPIRTPPVFYTALAVLRPLTQCVTPQNPTRPHYAALAASFNLSLAGNLTAAKISLSPSGLDVNSGLLQIPQQQGFRAFDVFYYLFTSASTKAEREYLALKDPSSYALLARSGTYVSPSYLPTGDDAAAAEDFRSGLKAIGIKGSMQRNLLSTLAGLLKLGNTTGLLIDREELEELCEDAGTLLGMDPEILLQKCSTDDRKAFIAAIYTCLVDWILAKANTAIADGIQRLREGDELSDVASNKHDATHSRIHEDTGDLVTVTVLDIPSIPLGRALAMQSVFDQTKGLLAEMKEDSLDVPMIGSSLMREVQSAVSEPANAVDMQNDVSIQLGADRSQTEEILQRLRDDMEPSSFVQKVSATRLEMAQSSTFEPRSPNLLRIVNNSRCWYHLSVHPTDEDPSCFATAPSPRSIWSAAAVSRQLRSWQLPEWANYRNKKLDFTADFDMAEFSTRFARLGCQEGRDGIESWILERGWSNGEVCLGRDRVWIREAAWWEAESMLDLKPAGSVIPQSGYNIPQDHLNYDTYGGPPSAMTPGVHDSGYFPAIPEGYGSRDNLLQNDHQPVSPDSAGRHPGSRSIAPSRARNANTMRGDYGLGAKGDEKGRGYGDDDEVEQYIGGLDPELADPRTVTAEPLSKSRRIWTAVIWGLTFWIPSFVLRHVGRMKRPDVRFAWREKVVLCLIIFLLNAIVIFYIVEFGRLLCPNFDKAWNEKEVGYHQGTDDFWVSIHGRVYDITKFAKVAHGAGANLADPTAMQPFAGQNLDEYFPVPLSTGCSYLVTSDVPTLSANNTPAYPNGVHTSGPRYHPDNTTKLHDIHWYDQVFVPKIKQYYKGDLVTTPKAVSAQATSADRQWFILDGKVYDLTDYYYTKKLNGNIDLYSYIPSKVSDVIQNGIGSDLTSQWKTNDPDFEKTLNCMENVFYEGKTDFRATAKCQVNNYILLAFTIILCAVILVKFVSALQFGVARRPTPQDKFVICQVPAYTEGEDQLRKGLDSLTALQYDNKRKLICVVCDGVIIGGGNDRPTPKIVLDILGVDPKIDPPALPFKSVGQGSEQLNYGKVYSGLYEYEGNVVPYIVVVKVGKDSEQNKSRPGNRGKRDSQLMLLNFLNRVHHRSPMSPLELEMFHQINNIIGVDPELYEYLFMVDADTSVKEDSLTRLVASCANDAKIAGICGETSLENEEQSWWTMIQVYEYYISHHLAKAFESLFGSVTCLPGCFCMYRLRTADKGRPLIISDKVIRDYDVGNVDTLHKKNLLSLGEDRYLTTIMTRHFPSMSYKFIPDAYASTAAPETWGVLLSQRRRWINSTIHNLAELVWLKDLCGFCCFSMRFVVFIDLFGTIILPATCGYLVYLIYRVATHSGQFPLISIVMIAAVYGLQAVIFIIKRQWQHIGWMIIYLLAFPIYSFILPIYSFWNQDNFSWGTTRIVIGEKGNKQIVALDDEGFDPRSIPQQRWDDYAAASNLPGRRGMAHVNVEKQYHDAEGASAYEMDDIRSVHSAVRPASTVLTGFQRPPAYMTPTSPATFQPMHSARQSVMSLGAFTDAPQYSSKRPSVGFPPSKQSVYHDHPNNPYHGPRASVGTLGIDNNLIAMQSPPLRQVQRSPLGSRPASTLDFRSGSLAPGQVDEGQIAEATRNCLAEVNLETVTKKQVRALVEQRLQTELSGNKRAFLDREIDDQLANM